MNWLLKQIQTIYIKLDKITIALLLVGVIILFFYVYNFMSIAPEYDELLSINGALNCPSNVFTEKVIWIKGNCLPIMLSSYIGGFSSIVYRLLFIIIPTTLFSFRALNILLLLTSLLLIYNAIKNIFDKRTSFVTTILLAFDFQLWFNIRFERTASIPFLLRSLFVYLLVMYLNKKSYVYLMIMGFVIGISIWVKFDAIFFYTPIFLSVLFVKRKNLLKMNIYRLIDYKCILLFIISLFVGMSPLIYYLKNSYLRFIFIGTEVGKSNLFDNMMSKINLLFYQFLSIDAIWYVFRTKINIPIYISLIVFLLWIFYIFAFRKILNRDQLQVVGISILLFYIFYILYGGMISSHHRFIIYPLPQLMLAVYLRNKKVIVSKVLLLLYLIPFIFSYYMVNNLTKQVGSIGIFSKNIYTLSNYLESIDGSIVIGDWGISTQLILLLDNPNKIMEIAFGADTEKIADISDATMHSIRNCNYIVLHKEDEVLFINANRNLRELILGPVVYTDEVYEVLKCEHLLKNELN